MSNRLFFVASLLASLLLGGNGYAAEPQTPEPAPAHTEAREVQAEAQEVNVYSAQQEHLIRPVLDAFTAHSGITVNLVTGDAASLLTRLQREGDNTPADLLLTADIGNIVRAQKAGLFRTIQSDILTENIPAHLRDSEGHWFGITTRLRLLFVRKGSPHVPKSYLALGRHDITPMPSVLIRSSDNVYNQSLMSYMIYHHGAKRAEQWARDLVKHMARPPQGGDREQLKALAAGMGNVAVANSYYYGMLVGDDTALQDAHVKEQIVPALPNQKTIGAHINIRGGGVLNYAKHPKAAQALLEYLSQPEAQALFAKENMEYPANPNVPPSEILAQWGAIKHDTTPIAKIGALQEMAIRIMDKVGWK